MPLGLSWPLVVAISLAVLLGGLAVVHLGERIHLEWVMRVGAVSLLAGIVGTFLVAVITVDESTREAEPDPKGAGAKGKLRGMAQ